jgi:hypothetical protein
MARGLKKTASRARIRIRGLKEGSFPSENSGFSGINYLPIHEKVGAYNMLPCKVEKLHTY